MSRRAADPSVHKQIFHMASGVLVNSVESALKAIAKEIGFVEKFPAENDPERTKVMEIFEKHMVKVHKKHRKTMLNELEGNWPSWRNGSSASAYIDSRPSKIRKAVDDECDYVL